MKPQACKVQRPSFMEVLVVLAGMVVVAAAVAFALFIMYVAFIMAGSS